MTYAILVGLNEIDPKYYGSNGKLAGCINDTKTWLELLNPNVSKVLINKEATVENFLAALSEFTLQLQVGDTLNIVYSGHGTQLKSIYSTEKDGLDEAFCFYNKILLDKRLNHHLAEIPKGIKVVGIFDCCHSGGVSRLAQSPRNDKDLGKKKFFETQMTTRMLLKPKTLKCSFIALNASLESQYAMDGQVNGLFTETMKKTFKNQPITDWVKEASKLVKVQTINFKTSGSKFDWSDFKI